MNYFIDIPTFLRFYAPNEEDDEKPPPDLKTTGSRIEEREIKKVRRQQTAETIDSLTSPADETMGSSSRKEKSSWPDWQFWKRGDGGPFGAFRKSTKSTGESGAFTFRKDINDAIRVNKTAVSNEHSSSKVAINVGQAEHVESKLCKAENSGNFVRASKAEKDDSLVSYLNESNGSKHVVINMNKVETMARRNGSQMACGDISTNIREEKYFKSGQAANTAIQMDPHRSLLDSRVKNCAQLEETRKMAMDAQRGTKAQSPLVQNDLVYCGNMNRKVASKQQSNKVNTNHQQARKEPTREIKRKETTMPITKPFQTTSSRATAPPKQTQGNNNIDEKLYGNKRRNLVGESAKKNGDNGFCKTIKSSVIPLPRLNPKQVAEKKQSDSKPNGTTTKDVCLLEQGKLHNVLKKVNETCKPMSGDNSIPAQNPSEPVTAGVPAQSLETERNAPGIAKAVNNQPELQQPQINLKPEYNATKKHSKTSQKAWRRHNVLHHGKVRTQFPQKATSETARLQKNIKNTNVYEKNKGETSKIVAVIDETANSKMPNDVTELRQKTPIMKDASTATPLPRATVDVEVQVPCEECLQREVVDVSCITLGFADETVSLLQKRPWDTERVLKMQVLLDEKQVVIGQLKGAGRRQRDELRASRRRCIDFQKIINQANMEGKPQLVTQINELNEIKNELVDEISRLTVEIERERTSVKTLKNELAEVKGQLNSARKRNANFTGQ